MSEGKIIRCCGDCIHYNLNKHRCTLGYNKDNPRHHFYDDCATLEDLDEHDEKVRVSVIDEVEKAINEHLFNSPLMNPIMTLNEILLLLEQLKEK